MKSGGNSAAWHGERLCLIDAHLTISSDCMITGGVLVSPEKYAELSESE